MVYVDGFVMPVPRRRRAAYARLARLACKVWMEHGALSYVEALADDVQPGKVTSFPRSVALKRGEEVWFSFITYRSRRHRDAVMKKVMADPRMQPAMAGKDIPFDPQRMIWGGFKGVVES